MENATEAEVDPTPGALPSDAPASEPHRLRQFLTASWVIGIVGFTLLRFVVARETLEGYGLNIWVFGFIDLVTAVPYAVGVARVVTAMIDRNPGGASRWAVVAGISFLAPYLYIAWAGQDAAFPTTVYVVLAVLIVAFGANAIWNVRRKVRAGHEAMRLSTAP
jgi:hypothetical protein